MQHELLRVERLKLQALQQAMAGAEKAEAGALSLLSSEGSPVPPELALRLAASARSKIRAHQSLLQQQTERTLDKAKQEAVAKRNLDTEREKLSKIEAARALEAAVGAFLARSRS